MAYFIQNYHNLFTIIFLLIWGKWKNIKHKNNLWTIVKDVTLPDQAIRSVSNISSLFTWNLLQVFLRILRPIWKCRFRTKYSFEVKSTNPRQNWRSNNIYTIGNRKIRVKHVFRYIQHRCANFHSSYPMI